MSHILLPATTYKPHMQARWQSRNTIIEDEPQTTLRQLSQLNMISPIEEDFPTPRANDRTDYLTPSSDATSDRSSMWSKRSSQSSYDELYDISDDDEVEVPFKCSASVKKQAQTSRSRYPSIVIPSPGAWPTVQKLQKSAVSVGLSPSTNLTISPATLAMINARNLQVPSASAAPSLDGSLTSEELAMSSCPSTPELQECIEAEGEWEPPIQLDPAAFETLHQLTPEEEREDQLDTVIEIPQEAMQEMQEIIRDTPRRSTFDEISRTPESEIEEPFSALSVPSPGGFFSSLDSSSKQTWSMESQVPSTSTAEQFYGVPWRSSSNDVVERSINVASPQSEGPLTARRTVFSPTEVIEVADITSMIGPFEYSETYQQELKQTAAASFDRTKLWLNTQTSYLTSIAEESIIEDFKNVPGAVPTTPELTTTPLATSSPSKKSVRFADIPAQAQFTDELVESPTVNDTTFYQASEHLRKSSKGSDAFLQRQTRAEALHVYRSGLIHQHRNQLQGKFEILDTERPAPARPISTFLPATSTDSQKDVIAQAEQERQALEQVKPSAWELQAQKAVFGGSLFTSPAAKYLKNSSGSRILDLGGRPACGWAWHAALSYPNATIITVPPTLSPSNHTMKGPSNHRVIPATNPWCLPFPTAHFDIVSARSLHAMLKTSVPAFAAPGQDEYDLTLRECFRVLKPNGYLEFNLLDAELVHASTAGQALGVEFAFNLKTRGYDPCASKTFLPRLNKAGFEEVKRVWMVLPMADVTPRWTDEGKTPSDQAQNRTGYFSVEKSIGADGEITMYEPAVTGSTKDVRAMTGLVGSRMWEQWMLKLQMEMGKPEDRALEGVGKALEEGGKGNAAFRSLMGWARKEA